VNESIITGFRVVGSPILLDAAIDVVPGEVVVLAGMNGVGKSTLLREIASTSMWRGARKSEAAFVAVECEFKLARESDAWSARTESLEEQWWAWAERKGPNGDYNYPDILEDPAETAGAVQRLLGRLLAQAQVDASRPWRLSRRSVHGVLSGSMLAVALAERARGAGKFAIAWSGNEQINGAHFWRADFRRADVFWRAAAQDPSRTREALVGVLGALEFADCQFSVAPGIAGLIFGESFRPPCGDPLDEYCRRVYDARVNRGDGEGGPVPHGSVAFPSAAEVVTQVLTESNPYEQARTYAHFVSRLEGQEPKASASTASERRFAVLLADLYQALITRAVPSIPLTELLRELSLHTDCDGNDRSRLDGFWDGGVVRSGAFGDMERGVRSWQVAVDLVRDDVSEFAGPAGSVLMPATDGLVQRRSFSGMERVVPVDEDWTSARELVSYVLERAGAEGGQRAVDRVAAAIEETSRQLIDRLTFIRAPTGEAVNLRIARELVHFDTTKRLGFEVDSTGDGATRVGYSADELPAGYRTYIALAVCVAAADALDSLCGEGQQGSWVFLLDEPDAHLDAVSRDLAAGWIARLASAGKTFIIASHSEEFVLRDGWRIVWLEWARPGATDCAIAEEQRGRSLTAASGIPMQPFRDQASVRVEPIFKDGEKLGQLGLLRPHEARYLLLVEGVDDQTVINGLYPALAKNGVLVEPRGGGTNIERILANFHHCQKWWPNIVGCTVLVDKAFGQNEIDQIKSDQERLGELAVPIRVVELDYPDIMFYLQIPGFARGTARKKWEHATSKRKEAASQVPESPWPKLKKWGPVHRQKMLDEWISATDRAFRGDLNRVVKEVLAAAG